MGSVGPTLGAQAVADAQQGDPLKKALEARHNVYNANLGKWTFYQDHYDGGPDYPIKINPVARTEKPLRQGNLGATRYLWQYPVEPPDRYDHRANRSAYIDVVSPVVDFYAATIGKQEYIVIDEDPNFDEFQDDIDLQGQSYLQFMSVARTEASVLGHVHVLVDSTRASDPLVTEADRQRMGIRPYCVLIKPQDLLNWRLDRNGSPLEVLFRVPIDPTDSVLTPDFTASGDLYEYRYWSRDIWRIFRVQNERAIVIDEGPHQLGVVPLVTLYHKRLRPFEGESLLKNSAKIGQLLTNWASGLDEAFENQMFAVPVLESLSTPTEVGVGVSSVLHLNPDQKEKFSYVTPDTAPFEASWSSFYRMMAIANGFMGFVQSTAVTGNVDVPTASKASGVSKAWDFFQTEKILARMANNEQEAAKGIFAFAGQWMGKEWAGSIQYSSSYDLSTLAEDLANLTAMQTVGMPVEVRKEILRRVAQKALPSLDDETQQAIQDAIEMVDLTPEASLGSMPPTYPGRADASIPPGGSAPGGTSLVQ